VTDHIYHSILIYKLYGLENFAQYTIPPTIPLNYTAIKEILDGLVSLAVPLY
jgi:hypothetical protein